MVRTNTATVVSRLRKVSKYLRSRAAVALFIIVIATAAVSLIFKDSIYRTINDATENIAFMIDPSVSRAYAYGRDHFDTGSVTDYDLGRSQYWFEKALSLDPSTEYVHHELARIAFLHGDFAQAMVQIDTQITQHGTSTPNSFYVRGLIEGYLGNYPDSAKDYAHYVATDPTNWAATNDLAWVLLQDNRPQEALNAINKVLPYWSTNPWLLNSKATALYELGRLSEAHSTVIAAESAVNKLQSNDWAYAYPGNDPLIAQSGLQEFQTAVVQNMHTISVAYQKEHVNVR